MASRNETTNPPSAKGPNVGLLVAVAAGVLTSVFWLLSWQLAFLLTSVVVISIVIWQACDPFAESAQWIGTRFHLPGSVRGATLDAIASSMPELFSGIFFVVVAISAAQSDTAVTLEEAGAEGYGSTIATCAGSAIYNMILIPAVVALVIAAYRKERPTVDVEVEVLARDGVWFLVCEFALLLFLFQNEMHWWMAIVFIAMYAIYIGQLCRDAKLYRRRLHAVRLVFDKNGVDTPLEDVIGQLDVRGITAALVEKVRQGLRAGDDVENEDDEETPEAADAVFGFVEIPMNMVTCWLTISVSTLVAAGACYFLVEVTRSTAAVLHVPTFFIAVILAAAASSVPDTFLSIGAAMRGDDSGAVSNAFGSNIFDICICLSIPLLVNSFLVGWGPVNLTQDGEPIAGLVGLRILLFVLTGLTLAIMWHNRQLTYRKAIVLCALYSAFIAYAVLGSLGIL